MDEQNLVMRNYEEEIIQLIRGNASPKLLREKLEDYHENDIAAVLAELSASERRKLYRILNVSMLSEILEYTDDAATYISEMDPQKAATVLSDMEADSATDILRALDKERRGLMIDLMDVESRKDVKLIASFDEDEIGSRMTTNCIIIRENLNVKQAMHELVEQAGKNDNISTLFVVDDYCAFYGAIDLKELIIARGENPLEDLIITSFPYVYGTEDIDDCIERLKDYSEDFIPVLDHNNRILGVITSQSIIEVVDEELGEDYVRFAGLTAEEDLKEPLLQSMKKRLPWLIVLLMLGLGVSTVVGSYERVVAALPLIMAFQSMILDMSGNTGTQSLAVTIRVITDAPNLTFKEKLGLVLKEVRVGFTNGLLLGCFAFVLVGLYITFFKHYPLHQAFLVSACIGVSLWTAMIISSSIGTTIPMVFKKLGVDPAVASGPLITTINDLIAVVTYYTLAWVLLIQTFHLGG